MAFDRALFTGRGIGYGQRTIVSDDVGAGIAPITVRCTAVLFNGFTIQVKNNVLTSLDDQTRDTLVIGPHVIISTVGRLGCTPCL